MLVVQQQFTLDKMCVTVQPLSQSQLEDVDGTTLSFLMYVQDRIYSIVEMLQQWNECMISYITFLLKIGAQWNHHRRM